MIGQVCNRCGVEKPVGSFPAKTLRCRQCCNEIWAENRRKEGLDPLALRRNSKANKRYGKSGSDYYARLFHEQGGVCAICKKPEWKEANGRTTNLCIDHNHETGKLRGLLCRSCNSAIGFLKDDLTLVRRAALYLRQHDRKESPSEPPQTPS